MAVQPSMDRRLSADAVSRQSSVRVVGGFTLGKWFVSLTGEVPLVRPSDGKPRYKPTVKAKAMREEWRRRGHDAPSTPMMSLR